MLYIKCAANCEPSFLDSLDERFFPIEFTWILSFQLIQMTLFLNKNYTNESWRKVSKKQKVKNKIHGNELNKNDSRNISRSIQCGKKFELNFAFIII